MSKFNVADIQNIDRVRDPPLYPSSGSIDVFFSHIDEYALMKLVEAKVAEQEKRRPKISDFAALDWDTADSTTSTKQSKR